MHIFVAHGCPHCAAALPVVRQIASLNNLELRELEVTTSRDNARLLIAMAERQGFKAGSVPVVFLGSKYWVGYTPEIGDEISRYAARCAAGDCPAPQKKKPPPISQKKTEAPVAAVSTPLQAETQPKTLQVPFIGRVDVARGSLWANTALISFVDGFNPCSLWVLTMLLALIIHTGSRGKIFLIGFVFLTVTSLVYVAFIAGLFSLVQLIGFVSYVRIVMAMLTLAMGIINIKDYFWFGKGISLTISQEKKPGILARMRSVVLSSNALWPMLAATVLLAGGVSLTEFSCTAGFPVLWVNLISAQQVSTLEFVLLLSLYMLVYQLDEIVIFLTVVFTLRIGRFQEKQGRLLKLFGGMLMLTLAIVLLIKPALLENAGVSLLVFAGAFAAAGLVLLSERILTPVFANRKKPQNSAPRN